MTAKSDEALKGAIDAAARRILEHPCGVVCKHWMLATLFSEIEKAGYSQIDGFVNAVIKADDETALSFESTFA